MEDRAVIFIDGSNFYHGFINSVEGLSFRPSDHRDLDFVALAQKLAMGRRVVGVRYYIGQVRQEGNLSRYKRQREFLHTLEQSGVTCRLGRVEKRKRQNKNTEPLARWLAASPKGEFNLEPDLRRDLEALCRKNISRRLGAWLDTLRARRTRLPPDVYKAIQELQQARSGVIWTEKAVDVMIATDMISMAHRDDYDVAYLLSADGDFTPVVDEVRKAGRKVFAASSLRSEMLAGRVDAFIPLKRDFFTDLWRKTPPSRSSRAARKAHQRP